MGKGRLCLWHPMAYKRRLREENLGSCPPNTHTPQAHSVLHLLAPFGCGLLGKSFLLPQDMPLAARLWVHQQRRHYLISATISNSVIVCSSFSFPTSSRKRGPLDSAGPLGLGGRGQWLDPQHVYPRNKFYCVQGDLHPSKCASDRSLTPHCANANSALVLTGLHLSWWGSQ